MVYRFRIVLDVLDDVFRDIEVKADDTLEDLHNIITQSFEFEGTEMASFYLSDNEWNQGEEIVLFEVNEGQGSTRVMNETSIDSVVSKEKPKLIYIYDFLDMWTFYVELADIVEAESGQNYPNLLYSHGIMPENPPEKDFNAESEDNNTDDDPYDIDLENLGDYGFDEQWN